MTQAISWVIVKLVRLLTTNIHIHRLTLYVLILNMKYNILLLLYNSALFLLPLSWNMLYSFSEKNK